MYVATASKFYWVKSEVISILQPRPSDEEECIYILKNLGGYIRQIIIENNYIMPPKNNFLLLAIKLLARIRSPHNRKLYCIDTHKTYLWHSGLKSNLRRHRLQML